MTDATAADGLLSQRLKHASNALQGERVTIGTLAEAHGPAAAGSALVLVSAACVLPVPGVGTVLGVGLAAMVWRLWRCPPGGAGLPASVAAFAMPRPMAQRVLNGLSRLYRIAERLSRHRLAALAPSQGLGGGLAALGGLMAAIIVLPLPLGNLLPAVALVCLGLGMVFRDGVAVLLAVAAGALALAYGVALGLGAWHAGAVWLPQLWG